ncbi:MAG: RsmE family RNA methyltransferase [Deltaproteobacteria bacterium]|nr:RsmE family RNA methyltransferase [Deltaproteobacteria bacterium]
MNLLLLEPEEVAAGGAIALDLRRATHVREVLRLGVGGRLRAGVIGGALGAAEIVRLDADAVEVTFASEAPAPAPAPIDLILAVPRPKALGRALQAAASMAVARVHLVNAWRVDKSYLASPRLTDRAIRADLVLGAEQGVTTHLPEVVLHRRLMAWFDAAEPALPVGKRVIAHARGAAMIEDAIGVGHSGPIAIAIGPEGGWIEREVETFAARGFAVVALGAPILRVEAAVVAALAQLALLARLRPFSP